MGEKKTVNLFSQTVFNHPFKYLCHPPAERSRPLGFEMVKNNRRTAKRERERKGERGRASNSSSSRGRKKKKDQQIGDAAETEQFEDERR